MDKLVNGLRTSTWNRRAHLSSNHVGMAAYIYTAMTTSSSTMLEMNEKDLQKMRENKYTEDYIESMRMTKKDVEKMLERIKYMTISAAATNCVVRKAETIIDLTVERYYEPMGVIGIIADSRPIKTIEMLLAIIQSGNGCAFYYSEDMENLMGYILELIDESRLEFNCINNLAFLSNKNDISKMVATTLFDLVIPIGSPQFCKFVTENARSRVVKINDGPTHIYVSNDAPEKFVHNVCFDSKLADYTSPIAVSTIIVQNGKIRDLEYLIKKFRKNDVKIYGCEETCKLFDVLPATHETFSTQFRSKAVNIKIVKSMHEAVNHINLYSSGCVDGIISIEEENLRVFSFMIASACIAQNVSTVLCDGETLNYSYELFFGSREQWFQGPISLDHLLRERSIVSGNGLAKYPREQIISYKLKNRFQKMRDE